jgi:hypothetical protein
MVTYNQTGVQYNEGRYNAVTVVGSGSSNLGGLTAAAIGTVTPKPSQGGGEPYRYPRPRRKKPQPVVIVEEIVVPTVKEVQAYCTPIFAKVTAAAQGSITFSAEDDDLQVLLML